VPLGRARTIREVEHRPQPSSGPLGADLPAGASFITRGPTAAPGWTGDRDAPAVADLDACVSCGLCLPHCPTYHVTPEEPASPRGRINAMKAIADGAPVDEAFAAFMDRCLVCRACEDVCPSHVPFGRLMERARAQVEPRRGAGARLVRWVGFHWVLAHPTLVRTGAALQPLARPFLPSRLRRMLPRRGHPFARLPAVTTPPEVDVRGTVALLAGCAQDRWFHHANRAAIRVLARNGWRVTVPRGQACCGALAAHAGRLAIARRLARRARHAFREADAVVVTTAACAAHLRDLPDLDDGTPLPVHELMAFLHDGGLTAEPGPLEATVAYHDACHAIRVLKSRVAPRALLEEIPGVRLVEIADGDRCCGAAGTYFVSQPTFADALGEEKADAVAATGADIVASANAGCTMQISAGLRARGSSARVLHPVEVLDLAYQSVSVAERPASRPVHSVPDP
jgi:glycolate oxidase iron-sulfur subunit